LPPRRPLRIFHITAIPNLVGIAKSKKLLANAVLQKRKMQHENIAYQGAQGKRATKLVAQSPGGVIHDYVPFYFAPRSPMLRTIDGGNVDNCPYRQADIAHLVTTVEAIVESELPYVFYDYNATLDIATCYSDLKDLNKIDWPLFYEQPCMDGYCQFWNSRVDNPKWVLRKETRQAEFLVHKSVPLDLISGVGVYSEGKAAQVREVFEDAEIKIPVEVKTAWYY
jgi:ssDNA thymidine ADP-ribosyltransferase, DarT